MKKKLTWYFKLFLFFFFTPVLIAGSFYALEQNGFFNISHVELELKTSHDQKNFAYPYLEVLNRKFTIYEGESLWRFSLNSISDILKKEKWVKDFRISRSWPSTLVIEVEPHNLSYLLVNPARLLQGFVKPVTDEGQILSEIDTRQAPSLALLKGEVFARDLQKRKKAIELLKSLPADGKMSHKLVSEVGYDSAEGYWVEVIQSQMKIKLGEDQFAVKAARVSQVMDYLEKRDLKARVIDANLSKKVLVRLRQNP